LISIAAYNPMLEDVSSTSTSQASASSKQLCAMITQCEKSIQQWTTVRCSIGAARVSLTNITYLEINKSKEGVFNLQSNKKAV